MKMLIYGAGVLSSVYAAHLHEGGRGVAVLARGKRLADIREHGIVLAGARSLGVCLDLSLLASM